MHRQFLASLCGALMLVGSTGPILDGLAFESTRAPSTHKVRNMSIAEKLRDTPPCRPDVTHAAPSNPIPFTLLPCSSTAIPPFSTDAVIAFADTRELFFPDQPSSNRIRAPNTI